MGIRFACHVCGKQLNIKSDLAGKRGVCPQCQSRFRIPMEDMAQSTPVEAVLRGVPQPVPQPVPQAAQQQGAAVSDGGGTAVMVENHVGHPPDVPAQKASEGGSLGHLTETPGAETFGTGSILDDEPDATWYVRPPSGGQYGPACSDDLRDWIAQGRVAANSLLWRDGWPQWRDASEALPELSARLPGAATLGASTASSRAGPRARLEGDRQDVSRRKAKKSGSGSSVLLSGNVGIGSERRSRTMRRLSMIAILIAITATLIAVLVYVINR